MEKGDGKPVHMAGNPVHNILHPLAPLWLRTSHIIKDAKDIQKFGTIWKTSLYSSPYYHFTWDVLWQKEVSGFKILWTGFPSMWTGFPSTFSTNPLLSEDNILIILLSENIIIRGYYYIILYIYYIYYIIILYILYYIYYILYYNII